ncbi:MAG: methyltransferase domain-containing protein [Solirubrobacterales bacterium]|nr:methyltransferase domain-containing protein [Solirubrobacterales bacterium]
MRICTIVARNYLPQARVLARSYAQHNHGEPCSVLVIDDHDRTLDDAAEPFEVLRPDEIGFDRFEGMAAMYDVTELATAVKPLFLRYLLERDHAPLAYFDPDIRFYDDINEIARLTETEGLVLTPHVAFRPVPRDEEKPTEIDLLASGTYNLGFIGLAPGDDAQRLIEWWWERLRFDCVIEHAMGMFVDQRWFDLVNSVVSRFHIVRDPGVNVAYWNLHERAVERDGDRYTVNGHPLRFFHFSGFDPARPFTLSKHQTRIRLPDEPVLAALCEDYAEVLRRHGFDDQRREPWPYDHLADGTALTPQLRRIYADGEREGRFRLSPFTKAGTSEFISWCQEPSEPGAAHGITRLAMLVYDARPDLRQAFPDLSGQDGPRFYRWICENRRDAAHLGLPPRWLNGSLDAGEPGDAEDEYEPWGVNVAGYLRSELGVGEAARSVIKALDARGVRVMPVHGTYVPSSRQGHSFAYLNTDDAPFPVNLICVNADQLPAFLGDAGPRFSAGRYTIGFWWWEVTTFPQRSLEAFDLVDEVWVGTEHVAEALRVVSNVPVVKVRIPVTMPPIAPYTRAQLGLPDGYLFFFMFDFHSVIERKNPMAVIDAFRSAFEPGSGASLVIKCINHESKPDDYDRLRIAAQSHPDLHVVDRYVSAREKDAMLAACDCYVSLHRSEGFGLTPAEAMYLGKPVIATRYSGNLDYMTDRNSYLVDYEMRPIGEGNFPYPADGEWADPNREHAATLMREVVNDPLAAEQRGQQAAWDIRQTHSPDAAGETMERRLAFVRDHLRARKPVRYPGGALPQPMGLSALKEYIDRGPIPRSGGRVGKARRLAFRAALRLMRPVVVHEQRVGERLLSELGATRRHAAAQVAVALSEVRQRDTMLQAVASLKESITLLEQRVTLIEAETHAIPFMEGKPFTATHEPGAGVVIGYRNQNGAARDDEYRAFEDTFRGSEEFIRERQRRYLPIIGRREPVLDFGCGRGEFLDLLREAGHAYVGVDTDPGMVGRCREKGHSDVFLADGLEHLEQLADASLGVVFAAQVIEHLREEQLRRLLALTQRKLSEDGILIAETVNPHSPPALKTFWVDLSHHQPIFPEVALELCREAGFRSAYFFHPNGSGDVARDRFVQGEFAVVARVGEKHVHITPPEQAAQ